MTRLQWIKKLQSYGFEIFPLVPNGKLPAIKSFTEKATSSFLRAKEYWIDPVLEIEQDYNIGIATTKLSSGEHLLVVDVDNKGTKSGSDELIKLELEGRVLPSTFTQITPTGGFHYVYKTKKEVKQGTNVLGPGLDIRARGGYILGAGSTIGEKSYTIEKEESKIESAPEWLVNLCNEKKTSEKKESPKKEVNQKVAVERAREYLKRTPVAVEGTGGDETTYKTCVRLKDYGLELAQAFNLLQDWNERCQPPWDLDELKQKLENAFNYSQNVQGADSPEAVFDPIPIEDENETDRYDPITELNETFAFIVLGGKSTIIRKLSSGEVDYIGVQAFKDVLKARWYQLGDGKMKQLSDVWMGSRNRRAYEKIDLLPGRDAPEGVYNLWRGFTVEPLAEKEEPTEDMKKAWKMFQEHAFENVCGSDRELFLWLMSYFAHLIQRPWEKPLTALVFHGLKGVGKSFIVDCVGKLFGQHYQVASHPRYLVGNFNNHFTRTVLFSLEEASWAGDKQAEGVLKDLITGSQINIEQKGREPFPIRNVLRIILISNEDWVVPATSDERRFAIFSVGNKRQGDLEFFSTLSRLLKHKGGNRYLLTKLMEWKVEKDVNRAPVTAGLLEQKIESLNAVQSWWFSCLKEGLLLGVQFAEDQWPLTIDKKLLRMGAIDYAKERNIKSWMPSPERFGKEMAKVAPALSTTRIKGGDTRKRVFKLPTLKQGREEFERFIGHEIDWEEEDIDVFS